MGDISISKIQRDFEEHATKGFESPLDDITLSKFVSLLKKQSTALGHEDFMRNFHSAIESLIVLALHNESTMAYPRLFNNRLVTVLNKAVGELFMCNSSSELFFQTFSSYIKALDHFLMLRRGPEVCFLLHFSRTLEFLSTHAMKSGVSKDLVITVYSSLWKFLQVWENYNISNQQLSKLVEKVQTKVLQFLPVLLQKLFDVGDFVFQMALVITASVIGIKKDCFEYLDRALMTYASNLDDVKTVVIAFENVYETASFREKVKAAFRYLHTATSTLKVRKVVSLPLVGIAFGFEKLNSGPFQEMFCEISIMTRRIAVLLEDEQKCLHFLHLSEDDITSFEHVKVNDVPKISISISDIEILRPFSSKRITQPIVNLFPTNWDSSQSIVDYLEMLFPLAVFKIDTVCAYGTVAEVCSGRTGQIKNRNIQRCSQDVLTPDLPEISSSVFSATDYRRKIKDSAGKKITDIEQKFPNEIQSDSISRGRIHYSGADNFVAKSGPQQKYNNFKTPRKPEQFQKQLAIVEPTNESKNRIIRPRSTRAAALEARKKQVKQLSAFRSPVTSKEHATKACRKSWPETNRTSKYGGLSRKIDKRPHEEEEQMATAAIKVIRNKQCSTIENMLQPVDELKMNSAAGFSLYMDENPKQICENNLRKPSDSTPYNNAGNVSSDQEISLATLTYTMVSKVVNSAEHFLSCTDEVIVHIESLNKGLKLLQKHANDLQIANEAAANGASSFQQTNNDLILLKNYLDVLVNHRGMSDDFNKKLNLLNSELAKPFSSQHYSHIREMAKDLLSYL